MSNNDLFTDEPAPEQSGSLFTNDPAPESIGKGESFLRGAGNNFPLAPQAIAAGEAATGLSDKGGYSKDLSDWKLKASEAKAANPISYGAGAVSGAVAPAFIPGVGEALEASPIAGNAILGAANAVSDTDLTKNPEDTLKQAAIGAGTGAATAGLVGALAPKAESLENLASKKAVQSVEMPSGIVGAMEPEERQELGQFLQENNLVGKDKSAVLEQARKLSDQFGDKIGEIGEEAGALGVDPEDHYKAVNDLLEKGGQYQGLANKEAKALARDYKAGANDILNLPDNPTWPDIQKLKEQYGKIAFDSKGEIKSEGAKDTYFALKDMLKSIADKAQDNPKLGDEYKAALAGYSRMQPIESGLEKSVDADLRGAGQGMGVRGMVGLLRKVPGPIRAVVGPMALATGHPYIAGAAALPELMNPAVQSKAASMAAKALPTAKQAATQELMDYLQSKYGVNPKKEKVNQ